MINLGVVGSGFGDFGKSYNDSLGGHPSSPRPCPCGGHWPRRHHYHFQIEGYLVVVQGMWRGWSLWEKGNG